uniref:CSON011234 protein n=1 Tax=Culicoides sonorensis TaxID=179676 RepID=A0A336KMW4_CULSO
MLRVIKTFRQIQIIAEEHYSISQISPKSDTLDNRLNNEFDYSTSSSVVELESSVIIESVKDQDDSGSRDEPDKHMRVERSALPILNDVDPSLSSSFNEKQLDHNDVYRDKSGRYFESIQPTSVIESLNEGESLRTAKGLDEQDHFLSKRGPLVSSGPQNNNLNNATLISQIASTNNKTSGSRQNNNPDIQDIITGIVKLLNGNVNVHANGQSGNNRRPSSNRINNRGPPRISESQPIPLDDNNGSTNRPNVPYPFDRPDGPIRPFITGVPIPEQIVPSMQQNYRPGFVSQNRLPWQRPRPQRPPSRRPLPPYKPIPLPEYKPEEDSTLHNSETAHAQNISITNSGQVHETDDDESQFDIVVTEDEDVSTDVNDTTHPTESITDSNEDEDDHSISVSNITPTNTITTIIQMSSEVNLAIPSSSSILNSTSINVSQSSKESVSSSPSTSEIEPSFTEQIQTTSAHFTSVTPSLETSINNKNLTSSKEIFTTPKQDVQTTVPARIEPTSTVTKSSSMVLHPRPGIVLDDPDFKPGGLARPHHPPHQHQRPHNQNGIPIQATRPPGYGEIFDITLSAIQGPGGGGTKQTVNLNNLGRPHLGVTNVDEADIIVSPSGDQGSVFIDGKRTYISLFGEETEKVPSIEPTKSTTAPPIVRATSTNKVPGVTGTGYAVAETEAPVSKPQAPQFGHHHQRPHNRPRIPQQPPVRIDTCIVGDDSTCDLAQNEKCRTEGGVSSCHCRPGYARRKHREPCRKIVSILMSLRVDRIYERRVAWDRQLSDAQSEAYQKLSFETLRAVDSAMSMTPFSDEFLEAKVNKIYDGDASKGTPGVFVNVTLRLEENNETLRPSLKNDIQRHLLGVIHRRNNNIGNSALFVESPPGSVTNLQDVDECTSFDLNDCNPHATCSNVWGSFRCECQAGFRDPWADQPQRAGRECHTCPDSHCNNRGTCSYDSNGAQVCSCNGQYYGAQCEVDGEVLGVAIGASVTAVVIIVLTLVCLVMWSRRWQKEHKAAMGSPIFGYMGNGTVKTPVMGQTPYQVTLEDRMRWAQIADVMAQSNLYAAEPVAGSTRPSSAIFGYPNLHGMGSIANMSMTGTLPMHSGTLPPVPLPRLNLTRPSGMRTLENSSSSEEEDRTDLLGRNFQVPRPKSRSNASIAGQSGIYYDVEYEPSGMDLYNSNNMNTNRQMQGQSHPGIPLSTYGASYYK